jgi:hypothetical protein
MAERLDPPGKPELHRIRQEWAVKFGEMQDRQSDEFDELRLDFMQSLGTSNPELTPHEMDWEWTHVIYEATPTPREYDLDGLGEEPAG